MSQDCLRHYQERMTPPPQWTSLKIPHRLRYRRTLQYKHHIRTEDQEFADELRSRSLEGELFRSTRAHILAADPTI